MRLQRFRCNVVSLLMLCTVWFYTVACSKENSNGSETPTADTLKQTVQPLSPPISEASAIADSKKHKDHLWVLEDSGNPPALLLLGHNGNWQSKTVLKGITNRDWEAMAILNDTLYVGDIGDNNARYNEYLIHYLPEPAAGDDSTTNFQTISFTYPDGAHDAEAMLVDNISGAIYIITKRDAASRIYKLPRPFGNNMTAVFTGTLPYNGVVDAALAPDGKAILIKTYGNIKMYTRQSGETIEAALQREPKALPYIMEPQGEAISFSKDGLGYFTLSETVGTVAAQLYFYPIK